ncbi:MAG: hypothetical protein IKP32_02275 [Clostridia bacterium]|nr:hypothetical protein [Clostridia bacterium]
MKISLNKSMAVFRTPFSPTHDLTQAFSGLGDIGVGDQNPVDFAWAGLVRRSCRDIWHADQVLALSTDEAPPMLVNGADIGGHHAWECAVMAEGAPGDWRYADIGTDWRDGADAVWTCLRVLDGGARALFVSGNVGPSETDYAFLPAITGALTRADGRRTVPKGQRGRLPMAPSIRSVSRRILARAGGAWLPVTGDVDHCDMARIEECYDIINPATVAPGLRRARPAGGFAGNPDLAACGAPMLRVCHVFTLHPDGAVVISFHHEALQPVRWEGFLALMYQEKCCPPGGSVRRYIPGVRPLRQGNRRWDFSRPVDVARPFPEALPVIRTHWTRPDLPPDRQIEQIRDRRGQCVAFAAGILPLADGRPDIRRQDLKEALTLVSSRKSYLTFCGTGQPAAAGGGPAFSGRQGAVYRVYYPADPAVSLYTVPGEDGGRYLYVDFMGGPVSRREYPCPAGCAPVLCDRDGDVEWTCENGTLYLSGRRGFAVFALPGPDRLQKAPECIIIDPDETTGSFSHGAQGASLFD